MSTCIYCTFYFLVYVINYKRKKCHYVLKGAEYGILWNLEACDESQIQFVLIIQDFPIVLEK